MIFDSAKHLDFYRGLGIGDRYAKAVDYLKNTDLKALAPGKYEIDGDDVFVNVMEYTTIPWEEAKFESHENYTDIQYMIEGTEILTYAPVEALTVSVPYNPDKDATLYDNSNTGLQAVVSAGEYMIFQPWDGHKPKAANGSPSKVKKAVVKIKEV